MKTRFLIVTVFALLVSNYASAEEKIPDYILLDSWVKNYYGCIQNNDKSYCFFLDFDTKELEKRGYCYELNLVARKSWVTCGPEHQKTE